MAEAAMVRGRRRAEKRGWREKVESQVKEVGKEPQRVLG